MAKLAASGTKIYFATTAQTTLEVVSVTKAFPAIMTVVAEGVTSTGDYITVTGGNWKSLSGPEYLGKVYTVGAVDQVLHTIEIRGANTVAEVETFDPTDAVVRGTNAVEICFATYQRSAPPASQIDVTTMCDPVRKKVAGLRDSGSFRFGGFYDAADPAQRQLRTWFANAGMRRMSVVPKDKSVMIFDAWVSALGETFGVDQAITIEGEGVIEGDVFYYGPNTWVDPDTVAP